MMYLLLLSLHSLLRWLVLGTLLLSLYRGYYGWLGRKPYTGFDNRLRHITVTVAHIQLVAGVWLYIISPISNYFLTNMGTAVHLREIRFFGLEHATMMLTGITLLTIGSAKAKRKETDEAKFKTQAIWFSIALLIIFFSIPWAFSPLVHRPLLRGF